MEGLISPYLHLYALRLLIALVLCGLIGYEREIKKQSAGFRTHILVGVGACMMMLLSSYGFDSFIDNYEHIRFDPARIPSYVISGIGFLGAGTIIVHGRTIRGLTTAASIWVVAGIGLVAGAGMYDLAIISTVIVLLALMFLNKIEKRKGKAAKKQKVEVTVMFEDNINSLLSELEQPGITLRSSSLKKSDSLNLITFELEIKETVSVHQFIETVSNCPSVTEVNVSFLN